MLLIVAGRSCEICLTFASFCVNFLDSNIRYSEDPIEAFLALWDKKQYTAKVVLGLPGLSNCHLKGIYESEIDDFNFNQLCRRLAPTF